MSVDVGAGLAAGASINVNFRLGVETKGNYDFFVVTEQRP